MKTKLENKIFKKYPKLFPKGRNVKPTESLMCFGLEVGDGWYDLIDNLCNTIQTYISNNSETVKQINIVQVKEKFGGLRFYTNGGNDLIYGMIWFAEDLSYKICEVCGKKGKLIEQKNRIITLCSKCKKHQK